LACSGCITSAETILIEQQNHKEFLKLTEQIKLEGNNKSHDLLVVSIALQPILSFASKYEISPDSARGKLAALFKKLGANFVYDIEFATEISLLECGKEFVSRFRERNVKKSVPVLAAACPGSNYQIFCI
jgi:iron only hydrogenase large subunit-like protein